MFFKKKKNYKKKKNNNVSSEKKTTHNLFSYSSNSQEEELLKIVRDPNCKADDILPNGETAGSFSYRYILEKIQERILSLSS